jgi:hypothetical protein
VLLWQQATWSGFLSQLRLFVIMPLQYLDSNDLVMMVQAWGFFMKNANLS